MERAFKSTYVHSGSKACALLTYLYQADVVSLHGREAAQVMGAEPGHVQAYTRQLIRLGVLHAIRCDDGMHYKLAAGVTLALEADGRWRCDYLDVPPHVADGEADEGLAGWLDDSPNFKRVCVPAAGLPMPATTGVRSVFELAQAVGAM